MLKYKLALLKWIEMPLKALNFWALLRKGFNAVSKLRLTFSKKDEIDQAIDEVKVDLRLGRYQTDGVQKHIDRIDCN